MSAPRSARLAGASFPCVAFDLDGTIYFGDTLAEGASRLLGFLEQSGSEFIFFTNNSVKTRAAVIEKLAGMGLPARRDNTYTSGSAVAGYLRERGIDRVAIVGSEGLAEELESGGISVAADGVGAQALVVGLVTGFDFSHRPGILDLVPRGVPIIAANMDMTYPVEGGALRPGCGSIVRAVEAWMGRSAEAVVGKPGTFMLDLLCREHGLRRADVLVVGDSLDSDIAMARGAGCRSVLIDSSGSAGDVGDTVVVRDLCELHDLLSGSEDREERPSA
jgi:HAD superfamily hydrolase (TIGR01450 family)